MKVDPAALSEIIGVGQGQCPLMQQANAFSEQRLTQTKCNYSSPTNLVRSLFESGIECSVLESAVVAIIRQSKLSSGRSEVKSSAIRDRKIFSYPFSVCPGRLGALVRFSVRRSTNELKLRCQSFV